MGEQGRQARPTASHTRDTAHTRPGQPRQTTQGQRAIRAWLDEADRLVAVAARQPQHVARVWCVLQAGVIAAMPRRKRLNHAISPAEVRMRAVAVAKAHWTTCPGCTATDWTWIDPHTDTPPSPSEGDAS